MLKNCVYIIATTHKVAPKFCNVHKKTYYGSIKTSLNGLFTEKSGDADLKAECSV